MSILPHTKKQWLIAGLVVILPVFAAVILIWNSLFGTGFAQTTNSFTSSAFVTHHKVLVIVPHPDDEINLMFGMIEPFVQAGSDVTVAFATNGDTYTPGEVRIAEAIKANALMGVDKEHIVLLGYGDHMVPPFFILDADTIRTSDAGFTKTYGCCGIADYHTLCYGQPAAYTRQTLKTTSGI